MPETLQQNFTEKLLIGTLAAIFVTIIVVPTVVHLRHGFVRWCKVIFRAAQRVLTRRKFVLVWNDVDSEVSHRLINLLGRGFKTCRFQPLQSPREMLNYPLCRHFVSAVVLLDCDVSKLSSDNLVRDRIQRTLYEYVSAGGGLVGSHDLIYRRARNGILEKLFGCSITEFNRTTGPVKYIKTPQSAQHTVCRGLPEEFHLSDDEVVWGKWENDTVCHFHSTNGRPLVVSRCRGKGRVVWLNSGDRGVILCKSVAAPQPELADLLRNSLIWVTKEESDHEAIHSSPSGVVETTT